MDTTEPARERSPRDTARYIENLAKELRLMAMESKLTFLAYLISMVEEEARNTVRAAKDK